MNFRVEISSSQQGCASQIEDFFFCVVNQRVLCIADFPLHSTGPWKRLSVIPCKQQLKSGRTYQSGKRPNPGCPSRNSDRTRRCEELGFLNFLVQEKRSQGFHFQTFFSSLLQVKLVTHDSCSRWQNTRDWIKCWLLLLIKYSNPKHPGPTKQATMTTVNMTAKLLNARIKNLPQNPRNISTERISSCYSVHVIQSINKFTCAFRYDSVSRTIKF